MYERPVPVLGEAAVRMPQGEQDPQPGRHGVAPLPVRVQQPFQLGQFAQSPVEEGLVDDDSARSPRRHPVKGEQQIGPPRGIARPGP